MRIIGRLVTKCPHTLRKYNIVVNRFKGFPTYVGFRTPNARFDYNRRLKPYNVTIGFLRLVMFTTIGHPVLSDLTSTYGRNKSACMCSKKSSASLPTCTQLNYNLISVFEISVFKITICQNSLQLL